MAKGLNRCEFIGHLGADPESRTVGDGTLVANFQIAVTESWKDRDGNKKEDTQWIRIQAWRGLAEVIDKYLRKGSQVYVAGKWQTREWEDRDGNKRYTTEVVARDVVFLGGKSDGEHRGGGNAKQYPDDQPGRGNGDTGGYPEESDYPF